MTSDVTRPDNRFFLSDGATFAALQRLKLLVATAVMLRTVGQALFSSGLQSPPYTTQDKQVTALTFAPQLTSFYHAVTR